ncbi:hypothetical protein TELCIR_20994, partial [Teladorsagia circumcincta]
MHGSELEALENSTTREASGISPVPKAPLIIVGSGRRRAEPRRPLPGMITTFDGYVIRRVGQGQIDTYACANIQNAVAAGLGTEVYMTPQPNSAKTGGQQLDEMYTNLRNSNINVQSIWIQVTSPSNWYVTSTLNINFINSILTRANQYGLSIGIYTSINEWNLITGAANINNAML